MKSAHPDNARAPSIDRTFVERVFGRNVTHKGSEYLRLGRVDLLECDSRRAVASVIGSDPLPYRVELEFGGVGKARVLTSHCSCPVGAQCKHGAAVALAWSMPRRGLPAIAPFDPAQSAPAAVEKAPSPWQSWAQRVTDAPHPNTFDPSPPRKTEVVLYLLDADEGGLRIRPVRCRPLRSGRLGDARPLRIESPAELARIRRLPGTDRSIVLALDPEAQSFCDRYCWYEFDTADRALLEQMLATGRTRWREPQGATLTQGAPRAIAFAWGMNDAGDQVLRPRLREGEGIVTGNDWSLYVDLARGEIGTVDAGALQPNLVRLARAPVLLPEHLNEAAEVFAGLGIKQQLPAPQRLDVRVRRAERVRATLTLARTHYDHQPDRLRGGVAAELAFHYDQHAVAADDPRRVLRVRAGERVELITREPAFEQVVAQVLAREGFRAENHYGYGQHGYGQPANPPNRHWLRPQPLHGLPAIESWLRAFTARVEPFSIVVETSEQFPVFAGLELGVPELHLSDETQVGSDWFEATLGIEVDGVKIDLLPILLRALADPAAATEHGLKLTLPDGRPALLPTQRLAALLDLLAELEQRGEQVGVPRARLTAFTPSADWRFVPGANVRAFLAELERFQGLDDIAPPANFKAELRAYQATGLAWLDFLRRFRFGGVLGDDMGLGKTVQVLAHLALEQAQGRLSRPALVVCPTSVAPNWLSEAERFAPSLRTVQLARGDRSATLASLDQYDLIITSYALMLRDSAALGKIDYALIVFDEAQWLKNRASRSYRAGAALKAPRKLCLTGTPVENHLGELKAQMDLVMPGLLGDERSFNERFRAPIERHGNVDAAAQLRRRLRPFLLRRTKQEVAQELPPRTIILQPIELDGAQRDLYETLRVQMEKRVRDALARRGLAGSRITVLDALLKLRQVCCDPRLVALPSARRVEASAKREALMDLLPTLIEDGRSILLFSQFTSMLDLIQRDLVERKQAFLRLDGSTANRRTPVEAFQRGDAPVFLISLKAGGVGLNLTRADTVILYDPWWNPAAEAQAIDRAHRIGQDKPVFVYELNCIGTVEEKMQALKARKRAIADAVLATGEAALASLGADDLLALFAPG